MNQNYQIVRRKQDIGRLISQLHREEVLAFGIMDTGSLEDLDKSLQWFSENMNHCLHVITHSDRIPLEEMQEKFPNVTFIVFDKAPSLSERINAMADVCMTTFFFLSRTDTELVRFDGQILASMMQKEDHPALICPQVFNKTGELMPTVRAPFMNGKEVEPLSFLPTKDKSPTLYPFMGIGLYDRALFQRLRGFDEQISGAYWQTLDFGTRCWLFGYNIFTVKQMGVTFFSKQFLIEDRTEQEGSSRFYTKALTVHQIKGRNFVRRSYKTDKQVMNEEVKPRMALYKTDFYLLCESWEEPE